MCEYCESDELVIPSYDCDPLVYFYVLNGHLYVSYPSPTCGFIVEGVKINHCPMCGRKLD